MNKSRSTLLAIGAFLLANLKWLVGFLKLSKFGTTLISMIISFGAYALAYGWKFGVALVYLIFVHEMGHLVAAKQKGIRTSPAVFIPFVGALISMKEQPRDAATEAYLAYGGPLAGLISFLPAIPLYVWTGEPFWAMVVSLGATINLFNLLPVSPLDGGRIVSVLSSKVWLLGLLGLGLLLFFSPSPMLFLIFLLGLITWWNRLREGYQRQIFTYEKEKLQETLHELDSWTALEYSTEKRAQLMGRYSSMVANKRKNKQFFFPFLQDKQRLERDRARLDQKYAELTWELYQQWERTPVLFTDGNPYEPIPSPLLTAASKDLRERLSKLEEQLHRLSTYYESSTSTKWKVLAAYVALAAVLSLFMVYGHNIMERSAHLIG